VKVRANFQRSYLWRYLIMACVGFFMALWFAFDGLVSYPKKLEYAEAYEQLQKDVQGDAERARKWQEFAESRSWPREVPNKSADQIRSDIQGQYLFGAISLLLGIPALYFYLKSRSQWVEETDDGLVTSWGQQVRFSDVTLLNKKKWDAKGIARVNYSSNGKKGTFVFDDFKFERKPLGQILRKLENVLQPEQIVGGISEAERDRKKNAANEDQPGDAGTA
jgi:hypothetical protein